MFRLTLSQRQALWAYAFLGIPLIFFGWIRIYPALAAFNISLRQWNVLAVEKPFVGLDNYQRIVEDEMFWIALKNTGMYVLLGVPATLVLGLIVALLIDRVTRFAGLYRMVYFLPYITSAVAVAWVWRWMYAPSTGVFNELLFQLHLPLQGFLSDPSQSLASITAAVVWQSLGFQIVIFLAGLKVIPGMYYEAAALDGANRWQMFWRVTLPLLNPVIVFSTVINTIRFLQVFTEIVNMSFQGMGGPVNSTMSLVLYIYRMGFRRFEMGYASAITVVLFIIILIITLVQMRVLTRRVEY